MPRLKEETRLERRDQIADAAWRCFARNGVAGTSVADIIAESGLSAGSIYSHFESKADLLRHVAAETLVLKDAQRPDGFRSPGEAVRALVATTGMRPELARVLVQVWGEGTRAGELAEVAAENMGRVHAWLAAGLAEWAKSRSLEPDAVADAILAALQGYIARLALDPTADPDRLLNHVAAVLDA